MIDTLYDRLKAAGVPLDHHESDLYAKVTPDSTRIIAEARATGLMACRAEVFVNQIDRTPWYDLPFQYQPFWDKVRRRVELEKGREP